MSKLKRSSRTVDRGDIVCHWCRKPGNGTSPYRSFTEELPKGVRVIVCSTDCKEAPEDQQIFVAWPQPEHASKPKNSNKKEQS